MTNNAERRTNMSSKITIIGAGSVGATIAYTLSQRSIASEIVLIDINKDKAEGEVMDIEQGTSFREPISIVAGDYPDAADSDIVIITSGIARKPGQTRIELTQTNVNIMKSITPEIVKVAPKALYIIVSNPCDIMTYAFAKLSGLPENQILGSGTALDTASAFGYGGKTYLTITISGGQIASIEQTNQDTPEFFDPAWSTIYSQIMANQSADGIDTVSGATYSSEGILDAAQKALAQAKN